MSRVFQILDTEFEINLLIDEVYISRILANYVYECPDCCYHLKSGMRSKSTPDEKVKACRIPMVIFPMSK